MDFLSKVDEELLTSSVAVLTGGIDNAGHALVTIPEGAATELLRFMASDLVKLLEFYHHVGGKKLALLANLRHGWKEAGLRILMDTLDMLECKGRGTMSSIILLKPEKKQKLKFIQHRLIKNEPRKDIPFCKVHLLSSLKDLHGLVDRDQLTVDYGGTLQNNHTAWIDFQKTYLPVISKADILEGNLQTIREHVTHLTETDTQGMSAEGIGHKIKEIRAKYECILEKYDVCSTIDSCRQSQSELEHPERDVNLSRIHSGLVLTTVSTLRRVHSVLEATVDELASTLSRKEAELFIKHKVQECVEKSYQVQKSVALMYTKLKRHPRVGQTESQARAYRIHFQKSILEPSKDIVSMATGILVDLGTGQDTTSRSYNTALDIAKALTDIIQPFTAKVNTMNESYTKIHIFHAVLEKAIRWKRKALIFTVQNFADTEPYQSQGLLAPQDWEAKVKRFDHKHPAPHSKHLALINGDTPTGINVGLVKLASITAERAKFIRKCMTRKHLLVEELNILLKWRETDCEVDLYRVKNNVPVKEKNYLRQLGLHNREFREEVSLI